METYKVTITGKTPLLMHADNIDWADSMAAWKEDPENTNSGKAGDDRTPAWRWIGCLYHDGESVCMPSDNLMRCAMEGGAMVPTGKGKKTFKAQSQSGMMIGEPFWKLKINGSGATIDMAKINPLLKEKNFTVHREAVADLGFALFLKRAKIGAAKHVRVRPRFDAWSATGTINVWDEQITKQVLRNILTYAGQYKGLGDWRPGSKTPGALGMFSAEVQ
jgi:hypothetical protein